MEVTVTRRSGAAIVLPRWSWSTTPNRPRFLKAVPLDNECRSPAWAIVSPGRGSHGLPAHATEELRHGRQDTQAPAQAEEAEEAQGLTDAHSARRAGPVGTLADPVRDPQGREPGRFGFALAAPFAIAALAYALWWISDRLLYIGPLDRAAFGWVVVIPVWLSTPIVAGFAWRGLTPRGSAFSAVVLGAGVGIVAAVLVWQAVAYPNCEFGANRAPGDWVLPSLFVGAMIGAGLSLSGLLATEFLRAGRPRQAAAVGAGTELALVFVTIFLAATMLVTGGGCQRPPT